MNYENNVQPTDSSKGKVTDLSNGFALGGVPFTVFVRPKEVTMETSTLLKCKLICDKEFSMFPVPIGDWTRSDSRNIPKRYRPFGI